MATTPANLMQTAVNAAATLVSAYVQAGIISDLEAAREAFNTERESVFGILDLQVTEAVIVAGTAPSGTATVSAGGGKQFTAEEARALTLRFGKFKDQGDGNAPTLGDIENFTASQCAEYGYGNGTDGKTGLGYIKYLANNQDEKASFMRKAATAIIEARRATAS